MTKLTGYALLEQVFGEEAEDFSLGELEFIDGVTDINQDTIDVDGWYATILHTFRYNGKLYSVEERSHVSDNVCDSEVLMATFCEVKEPKTVFLLLTHESEMSTSQSGELDAQALYEDMVKKGDTQATMKDGEEVVYHVEIKEFPGVIPAEFLELVTGKLLVSEDVTTELIQVQEV